MTNSQLILIKIQKIHPSKYSKHTWRKEKHFFDLNTTRLFNYFIA